MLANLLDRLLVTVDGKKTYLAALGLVGLGVFQVSTGNVPGAVQSFLAALGAAGLRHAIGRLGATSADNPRTPAEKE